MNCEKFTRSYLELENSKALPMALRLHLLLCKDCGREFTYLQNSFEEIKGLSKITLKKDFTDKVMLNIKLRGVTYTNTVSTTNWIGAGVILLSSIFLLQYSDSFIWLKEHFGVDLELPLSIVLGLSISAYAVAFIGTHYDELKDRFAKGL